MIPHELYLYGHVYRIRWAKPGHPAFDVDSTEAQVVHGPDEAKPDEEPFTITLDHKLKKKGRARIHEAIAHEVIHIWDRWEPEARAKMTEVERARVTRHTWKNWKPLSHPLVHQLDIPLARLLEQVAFRCVCERCNRRRAKAAR